jgi:heme exporter protein D
VSILAPLVVIALLALVVLLVSAPLRREAVEAETEREDARLADLQDAKDAKYREIREAELEYRTGHLSEADWRVIDRQLRAEAVAILREIDDLGHPSTQNGDGARRASGDRSRA